MTVMLLGSHGFLSDPGLGVRYVDLTGPSRTETVRLFAVGAQFGHYFADNKTVS